MFGEGGYAAVKQEMQQLHDRKVMQPIRLTEFRQPLQVQSHLEMPGILVQLGHTQRT